MVIMKFLGGTKMKKILIVGIAGLSGFGLGFLVGKKVSTKQYQKDVIDLREFYMEKLKEGGVMEKDFQPEEIQEMVDGIIEEDEPYEASKEYFEKVKAYAETDENVSVPGRKGRVITNYSKPPLSVVAHGRLAEDLDETDENDEEDYDDEDEDDIADAAYQADIEALADELAQRVDEKKSQGLPYVINHREFEEIEDGYSKINLYYYSTDQVLCEDDDTEIDIEDEEKIIGFDYEDMLEMQTTAWVRNDEIKTLYQIHRLDESYQEMVGNVSETPREREYRILARRKRVLDR